MIRFIIKNNVRVSVDKFERKFGGGRMRCLIKEMRFVYCDFFF